MIGAMQDITEREQAEEALRVSEEKFERAFRNSPDAILITSLPGGRVADANEGACRLTGFTREEMIGRTTMDLKLWRRLDARTRYLSQFKDGVRVEVDATGYTGRLPRELVQLLAEGRSNKAAADTLGISLNTVETHRKNVMSKVRLRSASDPVRYAIRNNLAQP